MLLPRGKACLQQNQPILVTGGAGFIGSNFVLDWLRHEQSPVVNLDLLTYAGNLRNLEGVLQDERHVFVRGDIGDQDLVSGLFEKHRPRAVVHLAAETHVDRSILGPGTFVQTNVQGTFALLEATRAYVETLAPPERRAFRFLHVSTDEVYGTLAPDAPAFTEETPYAPNSPYAASKAGSDMLVRAWHHTYGLPTLITHCSNNYGPFQFPEKLIPLMLLQALAGKALPVYGDGQQVRDWLSVSDHTAALRTVLAKGVPGETYNIGAGNEPTNLEVVQVICALLDERVPASSQRPHAELIRFVADRPGHDRRYAIHTGKIRRDLGWQPKRPFVSGLRDTVDWYLTHLDWVEAVRTGAYREWMAANYDERAANRALERELQAHTAPAAEEVSR